MQVSEAEALEAQVKALEAEKEMKQRELAAKKQVLLAKLGLIPTRIKARIPSSVLLAADLAKEGASYGAHVSAHGFSSLAKGIRRYDKYLSKIEKEERTYRKKHGLPLTQSPLDRMAGVPLKVHNPKRKAKRKKQKVHKKRTPTKSIQALREEVMRRKLEKQLKELAVA